MIKKWLRLVYIFYIVNRYCLLNEPIRATQIRSLRFFIYFNPFNYVRSNRKSDHGVRLRIALERLGPIFVKFGQALSTRQDILPAKAIEEISRLQDDVPPFSGKIAISQIEKSIKKPIDEAFRYFDENPLASASIAQVHRAILHNGDKVVVKVLRPNIHKILKLDTALMLTFAKLISSIFPNLKRFKPIEVVNEINQSLLDEIDLLREAANASQLRRNFENSDIQYIPKIYWDYTSSKVMVMEEVDGLSISDISKLDALGIDRKLLAERGVQIFYTQVFRDCFFHADMHPGNLFIDATNPDDPKYISIDFGIVGTLNRDDQQYLAGNFLAFFKRDYKKVAELHIESGWVPADTRVDALESAIRTVCEPIFEKPIKEISLGYTLMRLFQVARRFNMEVQPQLILLQKTLINIEGLGRQLYPELNLWETSRPILEKWMREHVGIKGFIRRSQEHLPKVSEKLPEIPDVIFEILQHTQNSLRANKNFNEIELNKTVQPSKSKFFLILGSMLAGAGAFYSINSDSELLLNLQTFIKNHNSSILSIGIISIIYYILKKER